MALINMKYYNKESFIKIENSKFPVYAHDDELLHVHIIKTLRVFEQLMDYQIIFYFYKCFSSNNYINFSYEDFLNLIKTVVCFHDLGKLSFNFQINKLNKNNFYIKNKQKSILEKYTLWDIISKFEKNNFYIKNKQKSILEKYTLWDIISKFEKNHSFIGALSFILKYESLTNNQELFGLILSYVIRGHHTKIEDIKYEDDFFYNKFTRNQLLTLKCISSFNSFENKNQRYFQMFSNNASLFLRDCVDDFDSTLSFFYMYLYSLLTVSDVFASTKYDMKLSDFNDKLNSFKFNNRITEELKNIMNNSFYSIDYNTNLVSLNTNDLEDIVDINDLRKQMLLEASDVLLQMFNSNKIFFLNMPTGAGKTNTSMKLALDLINNTGADRIIYGMPFINIIEQNYDVICESYGLSEENGEIRKIYSGSETIFDKSNESQYDVLLNDDFFNYPVICTTFVSLFNSIIKNHKKSKYKLAALTNSVIILDEIQSLLLKNWTSLYTIINELAINYNIYFIIMSATLPEFNKLELGYDSNFKYSNISLINNPSKYFDHNLFKRTEIKENIKSFSLVNNIKDDYFSALIEDNMECITYLLNLIKKNFNQQYNKGLMVFNTIKSSKIIFDCLSQYAHELDFEIDLLNSSLMYSTKKEIISKINNMRKEEFTNKKYILISTQSIEAGVDVSFDFVVRDFAILDSIEQVRGRCNRSGELNKRFNDIDKKGNIYLIKLSDGNNEDNYYYEYIYNEEERTTRVLCTDNVLKNSLNYTYSDIKEYYNNISNIINENNNIKEKNFLVNDRDNIKNLNKAQYSKLLDNEGIHIIDNNQEQFSIFICNNLRIMSSSLEKKFNQVYDTSIFNLDFHDLEEFYENNKNDFIFSLKEIVFIKNLDKKLYKNNEILAKSLLEHYMYLFKDKNADFKYFRIIEKEFASILYKFIINISLNKNKDIYGEITSLEHFGFFYILPEEKIGDDEYSFYSLKRGFNYNPTIYNHEIL